MRRRRLTASLFGIIAIAVAALAATVIAGHAPLLGLDLKGGVEVVLQPHGKYTAGDLNESVDIIDKRVNGLGVANSSVARQGNFVVVELPGEKNTTQALSVLGSTAQLYFRPVYCIIPGYAAPPGTTKSKGGTGAKASSTGKSAIGSPGSFALTAATKKTGKGSTSTTTTKGSTSTTAPATTTVPASLPSVGKLTAADCASSSLARYKSTTALDDNPYASVILQPSKDNPLPDGERYLLGPSAGQAGDPKPLSGTIVKSASAVINSQTGQYAVNVNLTGNGLTRFNKVAAIRNATYNASNPPFTSLEAIELDAQVESAPAIENAVFAGPVQITGSFTSKQASDLALELNYGSLPVRFTTQSVDSVSASIGTASLRAGLLAGIGGLLLVLIYMIAYYRALGLVVVLGLGVGGALLYSILTELSYTSNLALTLAGVTGIIVSIGITVDSYVVYFERLKDEVRSGKTIRASVERGFHLAFRTVLTADLVSFMAALILYLFTVGDVRGFAFTLGLSTLLDVFTAFFFIRPIVVLLGQRRSVAGDGRLLGIARGLGAAGAGGAR